MKVLDYNGLISLTDIIKENFIFRDTKEKVKQAIDDGKIPENAVVIITDDVASNGEECNFTPADIGLDKVGNYKAVSTEESQNLTDVEKLNARNNIGAGTSSFSGNYNDLSNKPGIPTKTSELTNDSNFVASNDIDMESRAEALIGNSARFSDTAKYANALKTLASDGKSVSPTNAGTTTRPIYFDNGVPVAGSYTLADACAKGVATAVANGNTNLVTSGAVYTALQNAGGASVESGTWTPKPYINYQYSTNTNQGWYIKIGAFVYIFGYIYPNGESTNHVGRIDGLPFAATGYSYLGRPLVTGLFNITKMEGGSGFLLTTNSSIGSVSANSNTINIVDDNCVGGQYYNIIGYYANNNM